jgi:hypothetical protein
MAPAFAIGAAARLAKTARAPTAISDLPALLKHKSTTTSLRGILRLNFMVAVPTGECGIRGGLTSVVRLGTQAAEHAKPEYNEIGPNPQPATTLDALH